MASLERLQKVVDAKAREDKAHDALLEALKAWVAHEGWKDSFPNPDDFEISPGEAVLWRQTNAAIAQATGKEQDAKS